ncbi:chaoptin [Macrobrachium rosenbergii]|uniref:chaoptin n=1 Tax=Macrobrachium rosenbergii TaxID=79674 RepID=UPI0034D4D17E
MLVFVLVLALVGGTAWGQTGPCSAVDEQLTLPCQCTVSNQNEISINCDNVAFPRDFPLLPFKMNIVEFTQRNAGIQALRGQLFTASELPLRKVDFSRNTIRRLNDDVLDGLEDTLLELRLDHNLLGNIRNPVFSSSEIAKMVSLQTLNLAHNYLRELDTGMLTPLVNLEVLHIEANNFAAVPSAALRGLTNLKVLTLQENDIDQVKNSSFVETPGLLFLNISHNRIVNIKDGAFQELTALITLDVSYNRLSKLDSRVFGGMTSLEELDLSSNFLTEIPADALKELVNLRILVLHDNLIQTLGGVVALGPMTSLEQLDLTRNNIGELPTGTFRQLPGLKSLKLAVNSIRKVEDDAFEGLTSLETLHLDDDNILSIPSTALAKVQKLKTLSLDYNRVGVISANSLQTATSLHHLSIAHNIIRELPQGTFSNFTDLESLNLYGNQLQYIVPESLVGLRESLKELNLGLNLLNELPQFDFPLLESLVLSKNNITSLPSDAFVLLPELRTLDLSENHLNLLPVTLLHPMRKLTTLDLSMNKITEIRPGQFNESSINVINLQHNEIKEIPSEAFKDLLFLHTLDLSHNGIRSIGDAAFLNIVLLHILRLNNNMLPSFKKEYFKLTVPAPGTELRILDISHNDITFLQPLAFQLHSKLTWLSLSHNRLSFFPAEIVRDLRELEHLEVENNQIKALENSDFANSPYLRELHLKNNMIETVSETAFQNSTQLQELDLSHNSISELPEDVFLGIARLHLDLSHNKLSSFPDKTFDRTKIQKLQSLDLSYNDFKEVPVERLRGQYFFLSDLSMAHNKIENVPSKADTLVNIKTLDLSYNPLSEEAIYTLLNEPKTVRHLNLAGTNVTKIPEIEARFLLTLNLSDNNIVGVKEQSFELCQYLQVLDMSKNKIPNLIYGLATAWPKIPDLRELDISHNPLAYIINGDFDYLRNLEVLKASYLPRVKSIERTAMTPLRSLRELYLHTFPSLAVLDVRGILEGLPGLEVVDIELTDREVHDQLHPAFYPRLRSLTVRGQAVEALSGGAFAGINSPELTVGLVNTSVSNLRSNVFFPVPMSSKISLDISDSNITSLSPQFLNNLDSRQRHLRLTGLGSNPLFCDCNIRTLRRWLVARGPRDSLYNVTCKEPENLNGVILTSLTEEDLTCEGRPTTTTTDLPAFTTSQRNSVTTDNIITFDDMTGRPKEKYEVEGSKPPIRNSAGLTNMDTVIIGIVGGVVAFVAILIILICLIRLRSDSQYRGGPLAGHLAMRQQGNCTCLKPPPPPGSWAGYPGPYPTLPHPPSSRAGTLKMMPPPTTPIPPAYGTVGGHSGRSYYPNQYYMGYPAESEHDLR